MQKWFLCQSWGVYFSRDVQEKGFANKASLYTKAGTLGSCEGHIKHFSELHLRLDRQHYLAGFADRKPSQLQDLRW